MCFPPIGLGSAPTGVQSAKGNNGKTYPRDFLWATMGAPTKLNEMDEQDVPYAGGDRSTCMATGNEQLRIKTN